MQVRRDLPLAVSIREVVVVRRHVESDNEAVRHIYAEAFRREDDSGGVPPEVGLFEALTESHDVVDGLSFVALGGRRGRSVMSPRAGRRLACTRLWRSGRSACFRRIRGGGSGVR